MPREARLESAGAIYHLLDRSRGRDEDRRDSQSDPYSYTPVKISGTVANVTANALNQYTQVRGTTLQYDGNFNVSAYGQFGFNYDAEKRLTSASKSGVTQVECTYDGLGRVVRRIEQGVTTLYTYDEWKPIVEWDGSGTMVAWNVYGAGADEILWRWRAGVGYLRYHADRMGNVTSVLDLAGNLTEQYSYDAYGMPTITSANNTPLLTSAIGNRFMFTGREYLSSIAAYDYRHRMYRPNIGRFLQMDPIGFDAGDMNLFRYCGYDPVDRSDPDGLVARVAEDRLWAMSCFFDGGNSFQGSWEDFNNRNQPGGAEGAGGSGKSMSPEHEGRKEYRQPTTMKEFIEMTRKIEGGNPTDTRPVIDPIDILSGGIAAMARTAAKSVAANQAVTVFRVWGDQARAVGRSWTTVDPRTVANFRNAAGLPAQNSGRFLSEGVLTNTKGVTTRGALPLNGNAGGLHEVVVPKPASQIRLRNVQGLNPEF